MIALTGNFTANPLEILRSALQPVIGRYDYIIIDCPPSLGTVTKNGLRISTGYVIPTIPDIVSTWGIYQIVDNVARFAADVGRPIPALGIVATKVQANNLHSRVIEDLRARRLGRFGDGGTHGQPPLFTHTVPQTVAVARGAHGVGARDVRLSRTLRGRGRVDVGRCVHGVRSRAAAAGAGSVMVRGVLSAAHDLERLDRRRGGGTGNNQRWPGRRNLKEPAGPALFPLPPAMVPGRCLNARWKGRYGTGFSRRSTGPSLQRQHCGAQHRKMRRPTRSSPDAPAAWTRCNAPPPAARG